jgi:two-component system LytT family response regulator
MKQLRVAVVDDEPPARRRVRRMLAGIEGIETIGEAGSGTAALELVAATQPDVLLLDIQMPDFDGFEVVRRLESPRPSVIFITAYDEHALKAFELHALDYLLKPFTRERFEDAIEHARRRQADSRADTLDPLVAELDRDHPYLERVSIRGNGRTVIVALSDVVRIDAADNYVILRTPTGEFLLRETLNGLEARLNPRVFIRVHRSVIVRISEIASLDVRGRGDYDVVLRSGGKVGLGRAFRTRILRALK